MAPSKAARSGQDDPKADIPTSKEKNGGAVASHSSSKMRRVASSAGSNLREVTNASATNAAAPAPEPAANTQEPSTPGVSRLPVLRIARCSCFSRRHNCLRFLLATASMARLRTRRSPRLPPSIPPEDADRLRQRPPRMDPHAAGQHWPLLADDCTTQRPPEAKQRPVDECGAKALQRPGRAGERHHRRLSPQDEDPGSHKEQTGTTRVHTSGSRAMSRSPGQDTEPWDGGIQHSFVRRIAAPYNGQIFAARIYGWEGYPAHSCMYVIGPPRIGRMEFRALFFFVGLHFIFEGTYNGKTFLLHRTRPNGALLQHWPARDPFQLMKKSRVALCQGAGPTESGGRF